MKLNYLPLLAVRIALLYVNQKPINISVFKPKLIFIHSLPSFVIRSMYEWNNFL